MKPDTSVPKLSPKREIDPVTGTPTINYYWEGRLAPKVQIKGKLVDQLSGLSMIKKDLDSALKWMHLAEKIAKENSEGTGSYRHSKKRDAFDLVKAYFVAALVFYGKCFTGAPGRHAQASRDWLNVKHRELHDHYMKYRHNFAAHSGDEGMEIANTYVLVHPDRKSLLPHIPTFRIQPDIELPNEGEKGLSDLIMHLSKIVIERDNNLSQKISELILSKGEEFWVAAADDDGPVIIDEPVKSQNSRK